MFLTNIMKGKILFASLMSCFIAWFIIAFAIGTFHQIIFIISIVNATLSLVLATLLMIYCYMMEINRDEPIPGEGGEI